MRYIVEPIKLDDIHPNWPGETVYKIFDTWNRYYLLGCYTTEETALLMLELREEKLYV